MHTYLRHSHNAPIWATKRKVNWARNIIQTIIESDEKELSDTYQMKYFVMLIKNENVADKARQSTPPLRNNL